MNIHSLTPPRAQTWLRTLLFAAILGGCGGGVDSGGTGGAATYANGPITGSGSIIVNGVRFDDSAAAISDDSGPGRNRSELKLGMVVEVQGSAISTDTAGDKSSTATSIKFNSELLGRVDSLDANTPRTSLVVIGQPVAITATTVFDDGIVGGASALALNDVVEVYALYNSATGQYTATRVERKSGPPNEFRIRGKVSAFDPTARTFNIGTEQISYASPADLPTGFANGQIVRIRVNSARTNLTWTATRLREGTSLPDDKSHARIEGIVNAIASPTAFDVDGRRVTTTAAVAGLALGKRVEVEGTMNGSVLEAITVSVEADSGNTENQFVGPIEAKATPPLLTITVKGQVISYTSGVDIRPSGSTVADLVVGRPVDVRATLVNGNQLQATRITLK